MKLSACMIVKNEAENLAKTLPNLAKWADEIILVDTGSTDETVRVAASFGAKIYHFPWINDFAAARNESLRRATGDWIIWIDADEFMKENELEQLRSFLETAQADAYSLTMTECEPGTTSGSNFYFRIKLFRNHRRIRFERPINEQLFDAAGKTLRGELIPSVKIYHWGARVIEEKLNAKKQRNVDLLKAAVKKNPEDMNYAYLLGLNLRILKRYEEAVPWFDKVIASRTESLIAPAHLGKARCLYELKKYREAGLTAKTALTLDPANAEAFCLLGVILLHSDHKPQAITLFEHAATLKVPTHQAANYDARYYDYYPYFYLGSTYLEMGDRTRAEEYLNKAAKIDPTEEVKAKLEELAHAG